MRYLKLILSIIRKIITGFFAFVLSYLFIAMVLSEIPVNRNHLKGHDIAIYILTNGDHTDVVLPVKTSLIDWSRQVKFAHTISQDTAFKYVALGWGDKGFYLNTPTWAQLKFSVAFKAATGLSTAAIHATFYKEMHESKRCVKIWIDKAQYQKMIAYINSSFILDKSGQPLNIKTNAQYGRNDAFYDAKRVYSIFYTCNTWANGALKAAGIRACLWTPFDRGIFYQYSK
ncbi:uncharacterized protein (TIGR02117 family) [Mucilaginibacter yixingensis]|uniref:Uncharacterized protein (TIGR02117 family) n=1 Tax=Mucilaginibacter yixingensis TaxID=1295612 RepID=A0A2T5J567_9SPHI|nr:TIGR02117 family protein [Mucilaginibacter yixingensis]PTQ92968.1 uncharacterized protein (TIGR02117 family) [Mucilaginibacter yixingensis]